MGTLRTPQAPEARDRLLRWIEAHLPDVTFETDRALPVAVMHGERIAAVVVYHGRRASTVEMSVAADTPRWAAKGAVAELLAWPFTILGAVRITALIEAGNARSRRFVEGLGFTVEGVARDGFGEGKDAVMHGFTRRDWLASRWHSRWVERHPTQHQGAA